MLLHDDKRSVAVEGDFARYHLVEHSSQGIYIGSFVYVVSLCCFGRHVEGSAHDGPGGGHRGHLGCSCDAEVGDFCLAGGSYEYFLRFEVSVNYVEGVGCNKAFTYLHAELYGLVYVELSAGGEYAGEVLW